MLNLKFLIATLTVFSILVIFPRAAQCDTSYYEKYYSARRYVPPKRTSTVDVDFKVRVVEKMLDFEQVALVGDLAHLGAWKPQAAIMMNRTEDPYYWSAQLQLPVNTTVHYRYFIAAVDSDTKGVQVRSWESYVHAREFDVSGDLKAPISRVDNFGLISTQTHEVERGWLHSGNIIQFQLFRNPLKINDIPGDSRQVRIKIQPVNPTTLTPILPSTRAYTEYVRMSYGDSFLRHQPEFGVPYKDNDVVIIQNTVSDMQKVAYLVKVYSIQDNSDLVRLIGYQYMQPDVLVGTEGKFTIDLISPVWLSVIGTLQLEYLVIHPLPNAPVDFHASFVNYWRDNWTKLDVGHRGLGKSLKQASNAPAIVENTVASMKASGDLGADMVEFDVQLTSDHVPIIYHDYMVYVCMDPKKPTSKNDLTEVLIKDVTYEQLKNLKTYQVVGNKIIEYPAHNNVKHEDHRLFPTFAEFLTQVNKSVGFDIEIKWPQLKSNGAYESIQTIDKNLYIDRILEVMLKHGCGRLSFFTSFDADICTLLRYKQNMYPVMFLSSSKEANYADPRSDTIYDTVNNAQAFDLAGIVPNAVFIQKNPAWIEVAHKQHKKVFLWGDDIKDTTSIAWFKEQQPDGVIYDRLDLWLPENKQNVFELESDLPEFFQNQCSTRLRYRSEGNATADSILSNVNML